MTEPDPARSRYFTIALSRMAGVCVALIGIVIIGRAVAYEWRIAGLSIALFGLTLMALVPRALARRWRTPRPPL